MEPIKKKIEVYVNEDFKIKLRKKAKELGVTMGEVIKRALEIYLA